MPDVYGGDASLRVALVAQALAQGVRDAGEFAKPVVHLIAESTTEIISYENKKSNRNVPPNRI